MKVLLVDDDPMALEILAEAVSMTGHEVETATNGREALFALRETGCRMVISDWEMPEMDGVELCRQVRGTSGGASGGEGYTYFILLTSRDTPQDIVAGLDAGADDFLTKPFNPDELAVRMRAGERVLGLETRDVAIFAMAKLAESRDPETGEHLERMRNYSRILAQELIGKQGLGHEVDEAYVRLIYLTSPLHDIGKVGIPDSVLLKPGRLSDSEFDIMKTHTAIGGETLEAAMRRYPEMPYLRLAMEIALTHHERWDGTGYPHGLSGYDIPLSGRIVALADVYDALTSKRVYKEAFTHEVAKNIIVEDRGKHFDPDIVDAFLACEQTFINVREELKAQHGLSLA